MAGALVATLIGGMSGGGSGGGDATPNAVSWSNCNGSVVAFNNQQTIGGINTPISLQITWTGFGNVLVSVASAPFAQIANGGSVVVTNGQTVEFGVQNSAGGSATGTVTVTNLSDASTVIGTFAYTVTRAFI